MSHILMSLKLAVASCAAMLLCSGCHSLLGGDDGDDTNTQPQGTVQTTPSIGGSPNAPAPGPQPGQPGSGPQQVVISPGGGLPGGMDVTTDGHSVWPPHGPGCDQLVACCQAAASAASDVSLFCQMSVATQPVNCATAMQSVRSYLGERGMPTPPQCAQ